MKEMIIQAVILKKINEQLQSTIYDKVHQDGTKYNEDFIDGLITALMIMRTVSEKYGISMDENRIDVNKWIRENNKILKT